MAFNLGEVPTEKLEGILANLEAEKERRTVENRLAHYRPYPKQEAFHEAGARYRERLLCAANQSGKSLAGDMECAMHATGRYPSWWNGKRFEQPKIGWCAGIRMRLLATRFSASTQPAPNLKYGRGRSPGARWREPRGSRRR